MPPPTASLKPSKSNGKDATASKAAVAPPAPTPAAGAATGSDEKRSLTKPDQAQYNAEQDEINKEIASIKSKLVSACLQDQRRPELDILGIELGGAQAEITGCCPIQNPTLTVPRGQ